MTLSSKTNSLLTFIKTIYKKLLCYLITCLRQKNKKNTWAILTIMTNKSIRFTSRLASIDLTLFHFPYCLSIMIKNLDIVHNTLKSKKKLKFSKKQSKI